MSLSTNLQSSHVDSIFPTYGSVREKAVNKQAAAEELGLLMIEKLFHPCVIVLQDYYSNIKYVSSNSTHIFKYSPEVIRNKVFTDSTAYLHTEDKEAYLRARQKVEELSRTIPRHELPEYRFVLIYRFRRGDGKYIHLLEEQMCMAHSSGHYRFFHLYRDITAERPFIRVHLEWLRYQNGVYLKVNSYAPASPEIYFSQRETEVLQLIKEGYSSKAIADTLCISINTVRNHRSNLFRKTQAKNMVELLNYAGSME